MWVFLTMMEQPLAVGVHRWTESWLDAALWSGVAALAELPMTRVDYEYVIIDHREDAMAKLLVFGVDSPQTAEKVFELAGELNQQQLLELADAAWVERTADGKVKLHQSVNLTAAGAGYGAASGAVWGTLLGLLFLNPLAGAVVGAGVGAGSGALSGSLVDIGVPDDLIERIGRTLQPGKAAVFFLARDATMDRVVEAIRPYNPTVIQTSLSRDTERELIQQLQQNHPVGASGPNS